MRVIGIVNTLLLLVLISSCKQQTEVKVEEKESFTGRWESVSDSGANAHAAIELKSDDTGLSGFIEYSTLASSGGKQRAIGRTQIEGVLEGNLANMVLKNKAGTEIGHIQLSIVDSLLKLKTIAEGVNFPDQFFMKRTVETSKAEVAEGNNSNRWNEFRNRGVEFLASGNEPFWSLEINQNGSVFFNSLSEINDLNMPLSEPVYGEGGKIVRYFVKNEDTTLDFVIQQMPCTDNMSGAEFSYFVSVAISSTKENKQLVFKGCGTYLGDYRLNDIWALTHINDVVINDEEIARERPYIELNINTLEMLGMAGCNKIRGKFVLGNRNIQFGPVAGTKMACDALKIEDKLIGLMSNQVVKYSIGSGTMRFEGKQGTLTFKKVD